MSIWCWYNNREADFLTNYTNKQNFVNLLAYKLELHGFKVLLYPSDADTTTAKTSLQVQDKPVIVLANDTDVLCLFSHHTYYLNNKNKIYIKNCQAFDKIWHEGLLLKLNQNSISGNLLKVLRDFLSCQKQRVVRIGPLQELHRVQKQPSRGVLKKRCSENMQQIYRRTPTPKCNFNKVALQLYWNRTLAWVFSCKFPAYSQNTFS